MNGPVRENEFHKYVKQNNLERESLFHIYELIKTDKDSFQQLCDDAHPTELTKETTETLYRLKLTEQDFLSFFANINMRQVCIYDTYKTADHFLTERLIKENEQKAKRKEREQIKKNKAQFGL